MLGFDVYVIAIILLFTLSSKTRATALVLLFNYFLLYAFALKFHGLERYAAIATIELIAGVYLLSFSKYVFFKHQDTSIAETYFALVCINVIGGCLYWGYYPAKYYDNMCITIMILQILILTWRVLKGGRIVNRCSTLHPVLGTVIGNINKRHSLLQSKKIKS